MCHQELEDLLDEVLHYREYQEWLEEEKQYAMVWGR